MFRPATDSAPPPDNSPAVDYDSPPDPDDNKYKKETKKLPTWSALVILLYLVSVFMLVVKMDGHLPTALTLADMSSQPDSFIEERARKTLRSLTSIGARPAGSYENEVLAVDLIKRELQSIKERTKPAHKLSIDIQVELCANIVQNIIASHILQSLEAPWQFQSTVC